MNTVSNTASETGIHSRGIAAPAWFATRPFTWSVQRELWENRYLYLAPVAVAGVFLVGFFINLLYLAFRLRAGMALDPAQQRAQFELPYNIVSGLVMGTTVILQMVYCLDCLYGERRDRSILFWKSAPVSDLTTVLSKATIPFLVLPLIGFGVTAISQLIVRLLTASVLSASGVHVTTRWTEMSFILVSLMVLYHLVTAHSLWYAPIFGWLMLISSWARRAPFLWAALPPFAIWALEKTAFNTSYFADMLKYRVSGPERFDFVAPGSLGMDPLHHIHPGQFLNTPGLWIGLAFAVACLYAASRLRRQHGPI